MGKNIWWMKQFIEYLEENLLFGPVLGYKNVENVENWLIVNFVSRN